VTSEEFSRRIRDRAGRFSIPVTGEQLAALETYFRLLAKWNDTINLTALPLVEPTDEAIDRLLIEPLAASPFAQETRGDWFDLGSGGGSPALPLKIARPELALTMVESRSRKAAFLREAIRELHLKDATVICDRFEALAGQRTAGLVTVRAVRPDQVLFETALRLLAPHGRLIVFHSRPDELGPKGFMRLHVTASFVVFHVEQ
jgi:16S rRNA (guanine527-N7)-methyltransferase